ncbi:response regulator [Spirosoma sp. HMF3257]|uniref:DNA-binding response regulator n=1 Tax=Spirosoma telluris TaxID=2183553 RepID=A0A327NQ61_9BACT|nr:response regulator [Spirosoma telluris]RAI76865.1 DNA-binding response regulator [Spirosoma telluris]
MNNLRILIIEDDLIWQLKLQMMLEQLNMGTIQFASSLEEAEQLLDTQLPDLVIADIVMADGLSFELLTKKHKQLPTVFQTGYAKEDFIRRAILLPNVEFLLKPFERFSLHAAIELLFSRIPSTISQPPTSISVIGKHNQRLLIPFDEIYWIKAEGNYSIINTIDQKYVLKRSLRKVADELTFYFVQVQKAYIINSNYVERVGESMVQINHQSIQIGRKYKKNLLDVLRGRN